MSDYDNGVADLLDALGHPDQAGWVRYGSDREEANVIEDLRDEVEALRGELVDCKGDLRDADAQVMKLEREVERLR